MSEPKKRAFAKVRQCRHRVLKYIAYISAVCLLGIMLVAFINVIGEKLRKLGLPVTGIPLLRRSSSTSTFPWCFWRQLS